MQKEEKAKTLEGERFAVSKVTKAEAGNARACVLSPFLPVTSKRMRPVKDVPEVESACVVPPTPCGPPPTARPSTQPSPLETLAETQAILGEASLANRCWEVNCRPAFIG